MDSPRDGRSASAETGDRLEEHPRTLCDGRKRLVGIIDGFATYYDIHRHRIDVRLERFDGTHYVTGYYQLQRHESVADFVRTAEAHGADCDGLSRWVERQLQPTDALTAGRVRGLLDQVERVVRTVR